MPDEKLKEMALEYLLDTKLGQNVVEVMNMILDVQQMIVRAEKQVHNVQQNIEAYMTNEDGSDLANLRIGTVLILAIVNRMSGGKLPKDFTEQDWKDIAQAVSQFGVMASGDQYAEFVFLMYARYIEISADVIESMASEEAIAAIRATSGELREMSRRLEAGEVSEVAYTEDCLWLALEGIVRLLTALGSCYMVAEVGQLATAYVMLAFEYSRYKYYQREQELLTEYIEHQYQLDAELQEKFAAYKQMLEAEETRFEKLMQRAFDPEFRYELTGSAELARACGVKEDEILKSVEDVDAFFM